MDGVGPGAAHAMAINILCACYHMAETDCALVGNFVVSSIVPKVV